MFEEEFLLRSILNVEVHDEILRNQFWNFLSEEKDLWTHRSVSIVEMFVVNEEIARWNVRSVDRNWHVDVQRDSTFRIDSEGSKIRRESSFHRQVLLERVVSNWEMSLPNHSNAFPSLDLREIQKDSSIATSFVPNRSLSQQIRRVLPKTMHNFSLNRSISVKLSVPTQFFSNSPQLLKQWCTITTWNCSSSVVGHHSRKRWQPKWYVPSKWR